MATISLIGYLSSHIQPVLVEFWMTNLVSLGGQQGQHSSSHAVSKINWLPFYHLYTKDNLILALVLHKCLLAIIITFKDPLSLSERDVPRIEMRTPITTDKIIQIPRSDGEKS